MRTRSRSARLAGALLLVPLLTLAGPLPGLAQPSDAPAVDTAVEDAPRASSYPAGSVSPLDLRTLAGVEPADGLETDRRTRPVAPGLTLTSMDRFNANGWLRADALTADLSGGVRVD